MSCFFGRISAGKRSLLSAVMGVVAVVGLGFVVYAATVSTGDLLPVGSKSTPHSLVVLSSPSLPPEVQAQEAASAPNLFDRDTTTEHVAYAESAVEANFEDAQDVRAVKVYGPAPYLLTVRDANYQIIPGLVNLDLTQLPVGWTTFNAASTVTANKVTLDLTPATGSSATGLRELEVWTATAPVSVKNGAALLDKMLGPTPLPQGRAYLALNGTANPTVGVIAVSSDDTSDNTFSFPLDRDPAHFVRAYLTYELYGQAHWISVRRSINSGLVSSDAGGSPRLPNSEWSTQVERINPAWLKQGTNTIEFSILSTANKDSGYTVRNVRVVGELDTGANMIEAIKPNQPDATGTNPIDALYDGDIATGWKPYPADQPINASSPSVEFEFRRPTQMDAVSFYLSAPIEGELQVSVKQGGQWIDYPPEQGSSVSVGWNTIYTPDGTPFDQRVAEGVKLTFLGSYVSSAEIREFMFIGSGTGARQVPPRIHVTYPDEGQFYGRNVSIQGFVDPWDTGSGEVQLYIGGTAESQWAGTFETWRSKDSVGFAGQADNDAWSVEVKAVYPDGETVSTIVDLTKQMSQAAPADGTLAASKSDLVKTKGKKTIAHDESTLVFDGGTVATDTTVTITPLAEDSLPALDLGMTNVTKGPRRGYRFLPHGAKFLKNVALALPYDKALIPPGKTEEDIKTFYFDENAGRWVELPRVAVDKSNKVVNSTTDHFTDMINATVTVPDHPQTVSFNPTSIKDIKAADPGAQVNLIEPPQANNMGDARLSYPIEVPPGRQGLQPQLAVTYNSGGGNGWMGLGWDLNVPSISIDTRWGVPRYSASQETETYTLNGEMLTPVAHRGALQARDVSGKKVFHTRVEGQFQRIIRYGTSPSTYWWEVTQKDGTRYIYGGNLSAQTQDAGAVLKANGGNVFRWALREVRDLNDNRMVYGYDLVPDVGVAGGSVEGRQLYLSTITYTGHGTTPGRYTVTFVRDSDAERRPDVIIDARGGFKQVTARRLKRIDVKFDTTLIRRYDFAYQEGAFRKTLLKSVSQFGTDAEVAGAKPFNTHTFSYYDEITASNGYDGFFPSREWTTHNDGLNVSFLGTDAGPSAIGGAQGAGGGVAFSLGFGPFATKYLSLNAMIGANVNRSEGTLSLLDIDGDGLPDKVFRDGGTIRFHRNTVTPQTDPLASVAFESGTGAAEGMGLLSEDETLSFNFGGQVYVFGLNIIGDLGTNFTRQRSYISDVNGDGLPDVVKGGTVHFSRWRNKAAGDYTPVFTSVSAGSEFPIGAGFVDPTGMLPEEDFERIEQDLLRENPLTDVVRRWTAPYSGTIAIDGDVHLIDVLNDPDATPEEKQSRQDYTTADGVRVAIERPGLSAPLWVQDIAADDFTSYTPVNVGSLAVNKGDVVYFRVQSRFDGAYDEVSWSPRIRYLATSTGGTAPSDATEVNRLNPYIFQADQDFVYAGRVTPIEAPFKGKLRVTGTLDKTAVTSDDVSIALYRFSQAEMESLFGHRRDYTLLHKLRAPSARYTMRWDAVGALSFDGTPDIDVEPRDKLFVLVEADSNIDLTKLQWRTAEVASGPANPLKLFYIEAFRPTEQPTDENGNPVLDEDGNPVGWVPGSPIDVQDDQGNYVIQLAAQQEMNFYPDHALDQAQSDFTATQTGWLMVNPTVTPKPVLVPDGQGGFESEIIFAHDSEMALTVKQRGELTGKRVIALQGGANYVPQEQSFAVPVYKGERLFFDFSTRDPELYPTLDETGVSVHFIRPQSMLGINVPVNEGPAAWAGAGGTLTVLPNLAAAGAPALAGSVVLKVVHQYADIDGNPVIETVVERDIHFDTQTPFIPYAHAFDLPDPQGGTFTFEYVVADTNLAAALTTHAVTIAIQPNYNANQQEYAGLDLFVVPPGESVPPADTGKALLSIGASAATVAIAPVVKQDGVLVSAVTGSATLTVARRYTPLDPEGNPVLDPDGNPVVEEEIIAQRPVTLEAGKRFNPGEQVFDVGAQANDTLVMYFTTEDSALDALGLDWGLWTQTRRHTGGTAPTATPPSMLHRYGYWGLFANAYRGWAYAGYNSEGKVNDVLLKDQPIISSRLTISSNESDYQVPSDPNQTPNKRIKDFTAFPAIPQPEHGRWFIGDEKWHVKAARMSASRMGIDYVRLPRAADFASSADPDPSGVGAGATAPPRLSIVPVEQTRGLGFIININQTTTPGQGLLDFIDLNGDRFPDVVGGNAVQYTEMVGGLGGTRGSTGSPFVRDSISEAKNIAPGGTVQKAVADARGLFNGNLPNPNTPNRNSAFGLTGSLGKRESNVKVDYVDVNGDGLPDQVFDNNGTIEVALNLGYSFAAREPWGSAVLDDSETKYINGGVSFNDGVKAYAGSLSLTRSQGKTRHKLIDINGDGLPDRVSEGSGGFTVSINTGNGFTESRSWTGGSGTLGKNQAFSMNGGVSFNTPIGPLCIFLCFTQINPSVSIAVNTSRTESVLQDVNGDGYADQVASTEEGKMTVALNRTGRTNLLKKVLRPLGATFDLEYTRDGNTHDMPQSRWVMTKVNVFDGHVGEGADNQLTTYKYSNGFYHRLEREFYGYRQVTEAQRDTLSANALKRSIQREFLNNSFYTKGLVKRETLLNEAGAPFTETEHTYLLHDVHTGIAPANGASTAATLFPQLIRTDKRFYEGNVSPGKTTFTTHAYDNFGNVTAFHDDGNDTAGDEVEASIAYTTECAASTYVLQPRRITVAGNGTEMRRREATIDCASGNVSEVRQYLAGGESATTNLAYFPNGNLLSVTGPVNQASQRYALAYEYDPDVATHIARITDSHGLSSQATHHLLFGRVETTTDTNGNQTTYTYDAVGRVQKIIGPYEQGQSVATLAFAYAPVETPASDPATGSTIPLTAVPWAFTQHVDKDEKGAYKASGTIDTILFIDGLKRVIQTKKDATVFDDGASAALDKMTVSGQITFDALGRSIAQRYPVTEPKGTNTAFNPAIDSVAATTTEYDVLDRVVKTTLPDASFTTIAYGFGVDRAGQQQFETVVRDNNVNAGLAGAVKHTYRDVRDLITSVKEKLGADDLWASYAYDPLRQIVKVTDNQNNVTTVTYDHLGRRTGIDNPDTGLTTSTYDLASNLIAKQTAVLRAQTQNITYDYDFNRLTAIHYPVNTGNDVSYSYGAPTQAGDANGNRAGRITKVITHTSTQAGATYQDSEERFYGKLGEVTKEIKTVVTFTDPQHPSVFETLYNFDTFGRLQKLTYPDGEVLTNTYDSGGNLKHVEGKKGSPSGGGTYHYVYVKDLFYDKFEQRVLLVQGNSVKAAYTYDARTRRLTNLTAGKGGGNLFQNLTYDFDKVGNILGLTNTVDVPHGSTYGGPVSQGFTYDALYRLTQAQGTFQYAPDKSHVYALTMAYDTIHNITQKAQVHNVIQPSGNAIAQKKTTYDWTYQYDTASAGPGPHAPIHIGERAYTYDANGNQLGWTHDQNGTRRTIVWDEENRIQSLFDQGHEKSYKYDDQGNRTIKRGPQGETVYVNQFFVQRPGATGTKHVYAGTTRVASKLMKQETPGSNQNGNTPFEKDIYFYHPDHLGSSSYITDTAGKLYEHLEYFPFGEAWVEENTNKQRTPYHFTAKELDEETGLYYFGARYYDPRTSVWQSADPALGRFVVPGDRLEELPRKLSLFTYSRQNPVLLRDPNGEDYEILVGGPYKGHAYGHVALRVFGKGYDVTYDFGRYGATYGLLGSSGEGILRVWDKSFKNYVKDENATGRTTTGYVFKTTPDEDKATMQYFKNLADAGQKQKTDPRGFSQFKLKEDYEALTRNCTTVCIAGVEAGKPALGPTLTDPKESKGRGLGGLEKSLAGGAVGRDIFMPADLQANIEAAKGYQQKEEFRTGLPLPKD